MLKSVLEWVTLLLFYAILVLVLQKQKTNKQKNGQKTSVGYLQVVVGDGRARRLPYNTGYCYGSWLPTRLSW